MHLELEKEVILKNEEILLTKKCMKKKFYLMKSGKKLSYQQKVFGFEGLYFLKKKS